jgi:predicted nucleic acid-binding protein
MAEKIYIDTGVIIDAAEGRKNRFGKNIGDPAADLFLAAARCKYYLIIYTKMLEELQGLAKLEQAKSFFEIIKKKIIGARYTLAEKEQAKNRSNEHEADALHIIIAEREQADYIITRNTDHFKAIGTGIPIEKPEKLL